MPPSRSLSVVCAGLVTNLNTDSSLGGGTRPALHCAGPSGPTCRGSASASGVAWKHAREKGVGTLEIAPVKSRTLSLHIYSYLYSCVSFSFLSLQWFRILDVNNSGYAVHSRRVFRDEAGFGPSEYPLSNNCTSSYRTTIGWPGRVIAT